MTGFIDREEELDRLRALYCSDEPELAVVWGRRRIGKTRLVTESLHDRSDAVYYQATETTAKDQLEDFVSVASDAFSGVDRLQRDWESVLEYLIEEDAIVVLDEFPYLAQADESLPSVIQRLWDHEVAASSTTFVLTGSSIGMMHDLTLDGRAPIYGRISQHPSGKFPIEQLGFGAAMDFFPEYTAEEQVFAYGIFGGIPHYLQAVDDSQTLERNIIRSLLRQRGSLHEEPELILRMEVDEVNRYFAVMKAIARGRRTRGEIAGAAGIEANSSSYYLDRLNDLRLIEPDFPVNADPVRSRKRRYRIRDHLFRFWFRFVYGRDGRYELYGDAAYAELIEPELPDFVSDTFETLCHGAVPSLYPRLSFTTTPGRWWNQDREIDLVGLTANGTLLAGEAKFTNQPMGYRVLSQLQEEVQFVDWTPRDGGDPEYEYALFSRSGFNQSVQEAAEEDDSLQLFSLEEVVESIS